MGVKGFLGSSISLYLLFGTTALELLLGVGRFPVVSVSLLMSCDFWRFLGDSVSEDVGLLLPVVTSKCNEV